MASKIALLPLLPVMVLAGCQHDPKPRQEYVPGYSYVQTDDGGSEKGVTQSVLAPNACLAEPADDDATPARTDLTIVSGVGSHLPSSCANAFNLQRMAESQRDLVEGRRVGPAPAAPTVRAARRYLDGDEAPTGGANSGPPETLETQ
jgi:hypothetical protein